MIVTPSNFATLHEALFIVLNDVGLTHRFADPHPSEQINFYLASYDDCVTFDQTLSMLTPQDMETFLIGEESEMKEVTERSLNLLDLSQRINEWLNNIDDVADFNFSHKE